MRKKKIYITPELKEKKVSLKLFSSAPFFGFGGGEEIAGNLLANCCEGVSCVFSCGSCHPPTCVD